MSLKPSEEQRLGKKIIAAQERLRLCMCKTGTAAPWHLAKAAGVARKPKLLERVAPHLEGEPVSVYLAALPGWIEQTKLQDATCGNLWNNRRADYAIQRDHLVAMLLRYDFSLRSYEKQARLPCKLLVASAVAAEAEEESNADDIPHDEAAMRLTAEEFAEMEQRIDDDLQVIDQARAELVAGHEELVAKLAQKSGGPVDEVIPFARHGLVKAAENFDVRRGHRFATYAQWWIKTAIKEKKIWDK